MKRSAAGRHMTEIQRHEPLAGQLAHTKMLPPHAPASPSSEGHRLKDALSDFVSSSRSWRQGRLAFARRTTVALWILVAIGAGSCVGLVLVLRDPEACRGLPCSVATFGGQPQLTLALVAAGTAALLTTAVFTRGLTRAGANGLWLVIPAAGLTLASVSGILLVVLAAVVIMFAAMLVLVLVFAFFADHT
ncbi:hypothetical protein EV652_12535 [Kribbella steppae]|uniref:Uncharacterized protein n=1 Tax=Kribbella steppae TaxID=2512223 RepID=A0A4R2GU77_9ACTN|nr:hypothetical protein [Kribbella steppae]TCO13875.1 hypothetical protein EV652_12535 [Kribbella steppae]